MQELGQHYWAIARRALQKADARTAVKLSLAKISLQVSPARKANYVGADKQANKQAVAQKALVCNVQQLVQS